MANNCTNCYSAHQRLGNTWTLKHMYRANNYNPFMRSNKIPFGPPGCVATGYRLPSIKEGFDREPLDREKKCDDADFYRRACYESTWPNPGSDPAAAKDAENERLCCYNMCCSDGSNRKYCPCTKNSDCTGDQVCKEKVCTE